MGGILTSNLAKPDNGIMGWFVNRLLRTHNTFMETNAVRLSDIQPDHIVLEVGFGPGIGLEAAYQHVKAGSGVIHGVELSERMLQVATASLKDEISSGKMKLIPGTVTEMPYKDNTFDVIFHTNVYYFWQDINAAVKEIHRVIKPNSLLLTVLCLDMLQVSHDRGLVTEDKYIPDRYMDALKQSGFRGVHLKEHVDGASGKKYQAIFATSQK